MMSSAALDLMALSLYGTAYEALGPSGREKVMALSIAARQAEALEQIAKQGER
jgi:hypothetical protein